MKLLLLSSFLVSTSVHAESNEFIQYYNTSPAAQQVVVIQPAPAPVEVAVIKPKPLPKVAPPITLSAALPPAKKSPVVKVTPPSIQSVDYYGPDQGASTEDYQSYSGDTASEVVSGNDTPTEVIIPQPMPPRRPKPRPITLAPIHVADVTPPKEAPADEVVDAPEVVKVVPAPRPAKPAPKPAPKVDDTPPVNQGTPALTDLSGCSYHRPGHGSCWRGVTVTQKIQKIVQNVDYINKLHGTKLDARYMLCTGWRESSYDPGVLGGDGEKGMFQVMPSTAQGALKYGVKLPGYTGLSTSQYLANMANSTVAQTELSFLTLKSKVDSGASSRCLNGGASVADYQGLARRYNGAGPRAEHYAQKIANCYSCMRSAFSDVHKINEGNASSCLRKAKD